MAGRGEWPRASARGLTCYYYSDFVGLAAASALKLSRHSWSSQQFFTIADLIKPKTSLSLLPALRKLLQFIILSFCLFVTIAVTRSRIPRIPSLFRIDLSNSGFRYDIEYFICRCLSFLELWEKPRCVIRHIDPFSLLLPLAIHSPRNSHNACSPPTSH